MAEKELKSIKFPGLEGVYVVPEGGGGGATGPAGKDGITPTIGANGNWYLGDIDTQKPSRGEKGADGAAGKDGSDGYSPEATVTPINGGAKIIIKDKNGTTSANVMNGAQGPQGPKGDPGATDVSIGITGAQVGQIAKITAVDTNGKPTKWEPVEMDAEKFPKFTKLLTHTITQDELESSPIAFVWGTAQIPNLNDFNVFVLSISRPDGVQITFSKWVRLKINNILMGNICGTSQAAASQYVITANRLFGVWISGTYYNPKNISVPVLVPPQSSGTYQSNSPVCEPVTSIGFSSYDTDYGLTAGVVVEIWGAK